MYIYLIGHVNTYVISNKIIFNHLFIIVEFSSVIATIFSQLTIVLANQLTEYLRQNIKRAKKKKDNNPLHLVATADQVEGKVNSGNLNYTSKGKYSRAGG